VGWGNAEKTRKICEKRQNPKKGVRRRGEDLLNRRMRKLIQRERTRANIGSRKWGRKRKIAAR